MDPRHGLNWDNPSRIGEFRPIQRPSKTRSLIQVDVDLFSFQTSVHNCKYRPLPRKFVACSCFSRWTRRTTKIAIYPDRGIIVTCIRLRVITFTIKDTKWQWYCLRKQDQLGVLSEIDPVFGVGWGGVRIQKYFIKVIGPYEIKNSKFLIPGRRWKGLWWISNWFKTKQIGTLTR